MPLLRTTAPSKPLKEQTTPHNEAGKIISHQNGDIIPRTPGVLPRRMLDNYLVQGLTVIPLNQSKSTLLFSNEHAAQLYRVINAGAY